MKFLRSVIAEMKIVSWPTKKKLRKDVIIVIETTILFALFFWAIDSVLSFVLKSLI